MGGLDHTLEPVLNVTFPGTSMQGAAVALASHGTGHVPPDSAITSFIANIQRFLEG